jgi:hypothetical protein
LDGRPGQHGSWGQPWISAPGDVGSNRLPPDQRERERERERERALFIVPGHAHQSLLGVFDGEGLEVVNRLSNLIVGAQNDLDRKGLETLIQLPNVDIKPRNGNGLCVHISFCFKICRQPCFKTALRPETMKVLHL